MIVSTSRLLTGFNPDTGRKPSAHIHSVAHGHRHPAAPIGSSSGTFTNALSIIIDNIFAKLLHETISQILDTFKDVN